ncbi:MAG: hypothetical protein GYB66_02730 [Chloroflexi bacterium]|nr:hypothetical protein [Chloroflexota bacterium]
MGMMNEEERLEFAEKLASLSFKKARNEIRRQDSAARLKTYRNSVNREIHTSYELPTQGVKIILVEERTNKPIKDTAKVRTEYHYVEARVIPWDPSS